MTNSVRVGVNEENDVCIYVPRECDFFTMTPDQSRHLAQNLLNNAKIAEDQISKDPFKGLICQPRQRRM